MEKRLIDYTKHQPGEKAIDGRVVGVCRVCGLSGRRTSYWVDGKWRSGTIHVYKTGFGTSDLLNYCEEPVIRE